MYTFIDIAFNYVDADILKRHRQGNGPQGIFFRSASGMSCFYGLSVRVLPHMTDQQVLWLSSQIYALPSCRLNFSHLLSYIPALRCAVHNNQGVNHQAA